MYFGKNQAVRIVVWNKAFWIEKYGRYSEVVNRASTTVLMREW